MNLREMYEMNLPHAMRSGGAVERKRRRGPVTIRFCPNGIRCRPGCCRSPRRSAERKPVRDFAASCVRAHVASGAFSPVSGLYECSECGKNAPYGWNRQKRPGRCRAGRENAGRSRKRPEKAEKPDGRSRERPVRACGRGRPGGACGGPPPVFTNMYVCVGGVSTCFRTWTATCRTSGRRATPP